MKHIPNGVLIMLKSYFYVVTCEKLWKNIFTKKIFKERKIKCDEEKIINDYRLQCK